MKSTDNKIKNYWDQRSKIYMESIQGVMDKSLPLQLNLYQDNWMFGIIQNLIDVGTDKRILDIGCGYGRISKKIIDNYPDVIVRGLDISNNYVRVYNSNLGPRGKAYIGTAEKLPFSNSSYDIVLIVATMMYVISRRKQEKVISEVARVLKKGGKVLLIEPTKVSSFFGFLGSLLKNSNKESHLADIHIATFTKKEISKIFLKNGISLLKTTGIPFFSLFLPFLFLLSMVDRKILKIPLIVINRLDKIFSWMVFPSIFIAYSGVNQKINKFC